MGKKYRPSFNDDKDLKRKNYEDYMGDIHRGDIFYFDKSYTVGVEQQGGRPGIIVSNDACNNSSDFLLVCYLTTQPKTALPTHVPVLCEQESIVLCEQIHTLSKEKMQNYYCTATEEEMAKIDEALAITLNLDISKISPEDYNNLLVQIQEMNVKLETLQEELSQKDKEIETLDNKLKIYEDRNSSLRAIHSVEDTPEYIRVCAERDVYIKLYHDLLNQK